MSKKVFRAWQDEHIASATICQDDGDEWRLDYFLQTCQGLEGKVLYFIKVSKSTLQGVMVQASETFVNTSRREEALKIINAFAIGTVPPWVLPEMVEEWEKEEAFKPLLSDTA